MNMRESYEQNQTSLDMESNKAYDFNRKTPENYRRNNSLTRNPSKGKMIEEG